MKLDIFNEFSFYFLEKKLSRGTQFNGNNGTSLSFFVKLLSVDALF
jgi:hypothetical protein